MSGSWLAIDAPDSIACARVNLRSAILPVLLVLGLSGCESSSGPTGGISGTWVLRSVAGASLPALVSEGSNLLVLSDTLIFEFHHAALFPLVLSQRRVGVPGGPPSATSLLYHLELDGSRVTLRLRCPPDTDCLIDERRGEIDGATLTLHYTPAGTIPSFRSPLVYQRVR
jgi:hypothetical protein